MKASRALPWQLAVSSIRAAFARSVLISCSFALGVALLLSLAAIPSAMGSRAERERGMLPRELRRGTDLPDSYLLYRQHAGEYLGRTLTLVTLASVGDHPPLPPGLEQLPGPGTVAASPALADLLQTPEGALLHDRLPGAVTSTIGIAGLPGPDSLVAYVGVEPRGIVMPQRVVGFGTRRVGAGAPFTLGFLVGVALLVLATLGPVAALLVAVTRLSTRSRESRLAALRLVGVGDAQLRISYACEAGVAASVGVVLGILLSLPMRSVAASSLPEPFRWFSGDFSVAWWMVLLISAGCVGFAMLVALAAVRGPLGGSPGSARRAVQPGTRPRDARVLTSGVVLLLLTPLLSKLPWRLPSETSVVCGLAATVIGMALSMPVLVDRVSSRVARRTERPALLVGMGRLSTAPAPAARAVTAVAILMLLGGLGRSVVLASAPAQFVSLLPDVAREPAAVFVAAYRPRVMVTEVLREVEGVVAVETRPTDVWGGRGAGWTYLRVQTDGEPATAERIENVLTFDTSLLVVDSALTLRSRYLGPWLSVMRVVDVTVAVGLLIVWTGLVAWCVDRALFERRAFAALSAMGVPLSILRRSVLAEVAVPLSVAVIAGWLLSLPATALVFWAVGAPMVAPTDYGLRLGSLALLLAAFAAVVTLPLVRSATDCVALHVE